MAEQMNIYQKLARIRKQVEVIQKNKSGYGYKYVSEDEILAKISVFMDKYGLSLIPNIKQGSTIVSPYTYKKTKTTGKGDIYEENNNEVLVSADMMWSWVDNDNPEERIDVEWALVGQQAAGFPQSEGDQHQRQQQQPPAGRRRPDTDGRRRDQRLQTVQATHRPAPGFCGFRYSRSCSTISLCVLNGINNTRSFCASSSQRAIRASAWAR